MFFYFGWDEPLAILALQTVHCDDVVCRKGMAGGCDGLRSSRTVAISGAGGHRRETDRR